MIEYIAAAAATAAMVLLVVWVRVTSIPLDREDDLPRCWMNPTVLRPAGVACTRCRGSGQEPQD